MAANENTGQQNITGPVIFTDLDGTLLDRNDYSYQPAIGAVNYLKSIDVPIIFCSAKTRKEQEYYRREMGILHPFIVENGGAIYIPRGYFNFKYHFDTERDNYEIIELGISHAAIRRIIAKIRTETDIKITGFDDMTVAEISAITGLDMELATRAQAREYDETIIPLGNTAENNKMLDAIVQAKLNYTSGGRLYEVMGNNDKGRATLILTGLFRKKFGHITTVGIGDNLNDLPMLQQVDMPFLVQKPDGKWEQINIENKKLSKVTGIGPLGWTRVISEITGKTIDKS
jgi:mannosyl-3-phosphoglycerate phosphatase